jgi:sulfur carrier protein
MNLTVNGKETTVDDETTVSGLLVAEEVKMPDMVSVELNGKILRRDDFDGTVLAEGDTVEFLYFMGGGSAPV